MHKPLSTCCRRWLLLAACLPGLAWLPGCAGDPQAPSAHARRFDQMADGLSIGGEVDAFRGTLVLRNGRSHRLELQRPGPFAFPPEHPQGLPYDVQVAVQPPAQYCQVLNGRGVATDDVTDIRVECGPARVMGLHWMGGPGDGSGRTGALTQADDGRIYALSHRGGTYGGGAVIRVEPGGRETVLYSFEQGRGAGVPSRLVQRPGGSLYGVTFDGGDRGRGQVFEVTLDGQYRPLHGFGGGADDGQFPAGPLLLASDGHLYGSTLTGGAHGGGTIFRIAPDGSYGVVHSFAILPVGQAIGEPGGMQPGMLVDDSDGGVHGPYGNLVEGPPGQLHGLAAKGGAMGAGGVFRFDIGGGVSTRLSFPAWPLGAVDGLMRSRDGTFHAVLATLGHPGALLSFGAQGPLRIGREFSGHDDGPRGPTGTLAEGSDGRLYGMSRVGGLFDMGTLYAFDPADDSVQVLHSFGLPLRVGSHPNEGVLFADDGSLYGATSGGGAYGFGTLLRIG